MLVVEGLLPFFSPAPGARVFEQATRMSDGQIRFLGLIQHAGRPACLLLLFWPLKPVPSAGPMAAPVQSAF